MLMKAKVAGSDWYTNLKHGGLNFIDSNTTICNFLTKWVVKLLMEDLPTFSTSSIFVFGALDLIAIALDHGRCLSRNISLCKVLIFGGGLVKFGRSYIGVCYLSSSIKWVSCPFHFCGYQGIGFGFFKAVVAMLGRNGL